jgi:hypothetical protein
MKRYINLFSLLLSVVLIVSFNDGAQGASRKHPKPQVNGAGIQLHRQNGTKHGTVWNGKPCNCTYCWGMCLGVIDDPGDDDGMNVIFQVTAAGGVQFFILVPADEDATIDPTFYVDENVQLSNSDGSQSMTVIAGQYPYCSQPGTVDYNGKTYQYTGSVVVAIQ